MPKIKTKSSAKKRFKVKKSGNSGSRGQEFFVAAGQSGKRHGMRNKSDDAIRDLRGFTILKPQDSKRILKVFLPYLKKRKTS